VVPSAEVLDARPWLFTTVMPEVGQRLAIPRHYPPTRSRTTDATWWRPSGHSRFVTDE
jgi:hypothetical protein